MNVPAIAKKTFEELRREMRFTSIINEVVEILSKIRSPYQRAEYVHKKIDEYNKEVFAHPLVVQLSPCKKGCSACCHTQVSINEDEAEVLAKFINEGLIIDQDLFKLQLQAGDDSSAYMQLSYAQRKCIFLDEAGSCRVYEARPSVCRTNAVIGEAEQCDTIDGIKPTRLIRTPHADMVIYASYLVSENSGSLPQMVDQKLKAFL